MLYVRFSFIILSIGLMSSIPEESPRLVFISRFVFHGMLLIDFINVFRHNYSFGRFMAYGGVIVSGFLTFIDICGMAGLLLIKSGKHGVFIFTGNHEYTVMKIVPTITAENFILYSSLAMIYVCGWELIHRVKRPAQAVEPTTESVT